MGCSSSTPRNIGTPEERTASKQIDSLLHKDRSASKKLVKLLLLGAGESGKSTVCKQIRKLNSHEITPQELQTAKNHIYVNIFQTLVIVAQSLANKEITLEDTEAQSVAKLFAEISDVMHMGDDIISKASPAALKKLWQDPKVQAEIQDNKSDIPENVGYFFENLTRILQANYTPTFEDTLRCRSKTSGIVEVNFQMNEVNVSLVDVGGQRTERRKWIHCFDDVTAVIFCASLSEYDQVLMEDHSVNRMTESLTLFEQTVNIKWFVNSSFVLFLNKSDLFEQKIKKTPLKVCFKDYEDEPNNFEAGIKFIEGKYMDKNKSGRPVYTHVTCATSTENMKFVFNSVKEAVIQRFMEVYTF
eukprot:TRINITY_DN5028_c0_g1_i1.p1 TRINITY_DN5028_c0_g1~~TRINITY_DN5028_c0_g1_i1.p1  ORF type:complete len:358 (+),score=91.20 TRINITY_DN5028_c0_g1_i1:180-1253(+)